MNSKLILCLFVVFLTWMPVFGAEVSVIARKDVPEVTLSQHDLINIFTRRMMFWPDGHRIVVFIRPLNSIEHKFFTINVLNLSPFRYKILADSITYGGANRPPEELTSDEEMMIKVSSTPHSIGYLNYTIFVNGNSNEVIKIRIE